MYEIDWQEIVDAHGRDVWQCVYRLVGNHADAADCAQETFLAAYQMASRQEVTQWSALLRRLATTKAIDRLRQRARRAAVIEAVDQLPGPAGDPTQHVMAKELAERLRGCVGRLPDSMAEVFCLRVLEDMSYEEAAMQLGLTTNAVGVLLHKARARLREMLSVEFIEKDVTQ